MAIIGNKGNGKSALTDVIAVAADSRSDPLSFLSETSFRDPRNNKAQHYRARVKWAAGDGEWHNLETGPLPHSVEHVKYIPQQYFEELCNERELEEGGRFHAELTGAIFSHVAESDRLGHGDLAALLRDRTDGLEQRLSHLRAQLGTINGRIATHEAEVAQPAILALEGRIRAKLAELKAHEQNKPATRESPATPTEVQTELSALEVTRARLAEEVEAARLLLNSLKRKRQDVDRLLESLGSLRAEMQSKLVELSESAQALGFDASNLIQIEVNQEPVVALRSELDAQIVSTGSTLDADTLDSQAHQLAGCVTRITTLRDGLDAEAQAYQDHLVATQEWETHKRLLVGSAEAPEPGSMSQLLQEMNRLTNEVPVILARLRRQRRSLASEIFKALQDIAELFRVYYRPVQDVIDSNPVVREKYQLSFNAVIAEKGFRESFLEFIDQRKKGPFQGDQQGRERLDALLKRTDFSTARGLVKFRRELERLVAGSTDPASAGWQEFTDQLAKNREPRALYDYLYGLTYLHPRYALRLGGRDIPQLSPGERGALLLIFYLFVAKDDRPLLIDQPEENLDNESIWEILVPCVIRAKQDRQIIMVTHNPNLAVVCDAEQVIWTRIDKADGNRVHYISGAIESPEINVRIVRVLEGTWPAFENRGAKYLLLDHEPTAGDSRMVLLTNDDAQ